MYVIIYRNLPSKESRPHLRLDELCFREVYCGTLRDAARVYHELRAKRWEEVIFLNYR